MEPDRDGVEKSSVDETDLALIRAKLFSNLKISAISIGLAVALLAILARLWPALLPEALVRILP